MAQGRFAAAQESRYGVFSHDSRLQSVEVGGTVSLYLRSEFKRVLCFLFVSEFLSM